MRYINKRSVIFLSSFIIMLILICSLGCSEKENTLPLAPIDITIDPNSTMYQELNVVGGWLYLGEEHGVVAPSRGLIVHRLTTEDFVAFERTPPYEPDSCCNANGTNCSKLVVVYEDYNIVDPCTGSKYLLLDGSVVSSPSNMPLGTYFTEYNGDVLYIHN